LQNPILLLVLTGKIIIHIQMKLIRLLLLLSATIIFSCAAANAQPAKFKKQSELCPSTGGQIKQFKKSKPKFGVGVKAGINYATQYTESTASGVTFQSIIGVHGGGYVNYFLLDFFAVQAELMVSGKGSMWQNPFYDAKYDLTYIDLPLLIKFQPVPLFNVHAGTQLSYLLIASQKDYGTGQRTNVRGNFYQFDPSVVVGVEANLPKRINVTVRYILGLTTATTGAPYTEIWKNKSFQLSIGYRLFGR
jgi:opacity protein-like surface antigen